jgi:hypothetical protein
MPTKMREQLVATLKESIASLQDAVVAAEEYDDQFVAMRLEQMLKETRELLKRAETELNN